MDRILKAVFSLLCTRGTLHVYTARGTKLVFGDGSGTPVVARFTDPKAEWAFLLDPDLYLGELYMDQRLVIEQGQIFDFLRILARELQGEKPRLLIRLLEKFRHHTRGILIKTSKKMSKRNVTHHYDIDRRIYDWMLDADKQYSCAYFDEPEMTLDEAQLSKKRHITAKLCIEPGQSVLDIGCGWGGLALYLAEVAQANNVLGITLADEQIAIAKTRASDAGLSDKVKFEIRDYRDTSEVFDRIVSVGMLEHVGPAYYKTYFETMKRCLDKDGVALVHTIGWADGVNAHNPWLNKYIFPSGYLPALSQLTPAIEHAGLQVTDIEVLRLHYSVTLREWRRRFMAHWDDAAKIYDERFCRMWEYYLSMAEVGFLYQDVVIFQIQIANRVDAVPITRDYIDICKKELRAREAASRAPFGRAEPDPSLARITAPATTEEWP